MGRQTGRASRGPHPLEEKEYGLDHAPSALSGNERFLARLEHGECLAEQRQFEEAPEPWVAARDCKAPTLLLQAPARTEQDTQQGSAGATLVAEIHDEARTSHLDREVDAPGYASRGVSFSTSDQHGSLRRARHTVAELDHGKDVPTASSAETGSLS